MTDKAKTIHQVKPSQAFTAPSQCALRVGFPFLSLSKESEIFEASQVSTLNLSPKTSGPLDNRERFDILLPVLGQYFSKRR